MSGMKTLANWHAMVNQTRIEHADQSSRENRNAVNRME